MRRKHIMAEKLDPNDLVTSQELTRMIKKFETAVSRGLI